MKDRIKKLRKDLGFTQAEFSSKIGLSRNFIAQIETGKKYPSDRTISDICREFNVNEIWLRTGKGSPIIKRTKNQEIQAFANDVMELPDKNLKKRIVEGLARLDEDDWNKILEIIEKLLQDDNASKEGV